MESGKFKVTEVCFAGVPQLSIPSSVIEKDRLVISQKIIAVMIFFFNFTTGLL